MPLIFRRKIWLNGLIPQVYSQSTYYQWRSPNPAREADLSLWGDSLRNFRHKGQLVVRHSLVNMEWALQELTIDNLFKEYFKRNFQKIAKMMPILMWIHHYSCSNWNLKKVFDVNNLKAVIHANDKISKPNYPLCTPSHP